MNRNPHKHRANAVFLLAALILIATTVAGCTKTHEQKDRNPKVILQVNHPPYVMTMYPQYKSESLSTLHLDIRKTGQIEDGAEVSAHLIARDGDEKDVVFEQDPEIRTYVAKVSLKHDEGYVIETLVRLKDKTILRPIFSFHCGDPIPHVLNSDEAIEAGAKK